MATKCSIAPAIVWNWVIEALASYDKTDISTLVGLVKMAPAISGDAGKHTREIVSLRIMENLFDNINETTVDAKTPKKSFDSSECCEDVLKKILHETPVHIDKLEKEKWDVGPFLKHKRSSLPKCMLKKLKEAVVDDSNPLFASLKEKSKLVTSNASDIKFQENVWQDDNMLQDTYTEGNNKRVSLEKIKNLEFVVNSKDSNIVQPNLKLASTSGKDNNEFQENMMQDDSMPHEIYKEGFNKRVTVGNMENLEFVVNCKDSNNFIRTNNKIVNDYDDYERTDVAAKKEAFLKFQCTSQDPLTLTEWSEINLCMKCNKKGELLICSSDSCALQFHESCLGFDATFEENREFLCPFCAYSRAILNYQEAKKRASLARKNLQLFSNFTVQVRSHTSPTKQSEFEENEDAQMGDNNNINCVFNEKDTVIPDTLIPDVNVNVNDNDDDDDDDDQFVEQTTELTQNPIPEPSTPKQKCKEKESQRSTQPCLTIGLRKRKAKNTPPPVLILRRKKLRWTKLEEEILKEGVERYASVDNNKIPWKDILDFGHKVFYKGRTTIDLKDKWRNLCK